MSLKSYKRNELLFWMGALVFLFLLGGGESSSCLLQYVGIEKCFGCGLGRSIHALMHGNIVQSFKYHPLGFVALAIILYRIMELLKSNRKRLEKLNHHYYETENITSTSGH